MTLPSVNRLSFTLEAVDPWSGARAGRMRTRRAVVETPIFMPVATLGALRGAELPVVEQLEYPILLANTYHLLLRLGPDYLRERGGLNRFTTWPNSFLTDSGGFQVFSLSRSCRIEEEGAHFRSYIDGSEVFLAPEQSIGMQAAIDSDIMMVLDQCIDATSDRVASEKALLLSARWAKRSLAARAENSAQALFGIVQGACYTDLRSRSAELTTTLPFDGFAIGGLAVGEPRPIREDMVGFTAPLLPSDRPRYLMGVGTPIDLLEAVRRGMDMFDCILPTNLAHQGVCFTSEGRIDLRRSMYRAHGDVPLDNACDCRTCKRYTRSYLHHLIKSGEHIAHHLLSTHNLTFYRALMRNIRASIIAGTFRSFYEQTKPILERSDGSGEAPPPPRSSRLGAMTLGDYEVVIHPERKTGAIRQRSSGETMHSVLEGMAEARALYVDQLELVERAHSEAGESPLVIWDVGLGAATNAMAAIRALEDQVGAAGRQVQIMSFERDMDSLRLALRHSPVFSHLWHQAPRTLLEEGGWSSKKSRISWRLIEGDFAHILPQIVTQAADIPAPHVIWFDPFSLKADSPLWKGLVFEQLLLCARRAAMDTRGVTELATYSASTAVRGLLLASGWHVGEGDSTGPKVSTTIAFSGPPCSDTSTGRKRTIRLLGTRWLERWARSDVRVPSGLHIDAAEYERRIRAHPQFV